MTNILLFKFENSNYQGTSGSVYNVKKFFYKLRQSELNKNFYKNIIIQSFNFIIATLPLLYYSSSNDGYNLNYLLSTIKEKDFIMLWMFLNVLGFYVNDIKSHKNVLEELTSLFTAIVFLVFIFLLLVKIPELGVYTNNIVLNAVTIFSAIGLLLFTRMIFHRNMAQCQLDISIQQLKVISYDIFRLSLCFVMVSLMMRMFNIDLEEMSDRFIAYSLTCFFFFIFKFENLIWKNITLDQNNYLYNKFQKYIQYGLIVVLCLLFYFY